MVKKAIWKRILVLLGEAMVELVLVKAQLGWTAVVPAETEHTNITAKFAWYIKDHFIFLCPEEQKKVESRNTHNLA